MTALAFGAPDATKPVRRAAARLRLPWDAMRLRSAHANRTLYVNGPNEVVVIAPAGLSAVSVLPVLPLPLALVIILTVAAWMGSVPVVLGALGVLALFALWLLLMAAPAALRPRRTAAIAAQQRLVKSSKGFGISSAAKAPKGEAQEPDLGVGTLGRIAALLEQRPELQPCFAVAAHPRYATAYGRYMKPVGTTGLLFASHYESVEDNEETESDNEERRNNPTPLQGQEPAGR